MEDDRSGSPDAEEVHLMTRIFQKVRAESVERWGLPLELIHEVRDVLPDDELDRLHGAVDIVAALLDVIYDSPVDTVRTYENQSTGPWGLPSNLFEEVRAALPEEDIERFQTIEEVVIALVREIYASLDESDSDTEIEQSPGYTVLYL